MLSTAVHFSWIGQLNFSSFSFPVLSVSWNTRKDWWSIWSDKYLPIKEKLLLLSQSSLSHETHVKTGGPSDLTNIYLSIKAEVGNFNKNNF